jgi:hypothetical protein
VGENYQKTPSIFSYLTKLWPLKATILFGGVCYLSIKGVAILQGELPKLSPNLTTIGGGILQINKN